MIKLTIAESKMKIKLFLTTVIFASSLLILSACFHDEDEECLANGENCSSSYIDANYGGNRPPCCNSGDVCQESPNGFLTCN